MAFQIFECSLASLFSAQVWALRYNSWLYNLKTYILKWTWKIGSTSRYWPPSPPFSPLLIESFLFSHQPLLQSPQFTKQGQLVFWAQSISVGSAVPASLRGESTRRGRRRASWRIWCCAEDDGEGICVPIYSLNEDEVGLWPGGWVVAELPKFTESQCSDRLWFY